ncbi:PR domain zinc finger protein 13 [Eumeta japonica]|uniref:PR domain zinc finger protein 13 n=1 Tax=Eumeta variegata TaxID=151549 RepID=A0A4C1U1R1_EUMVA|nr:PR domain zinc finger protein 13 [Eumeta japonica]
MAGNNEMPRQVVALRGLPRDRVSRAFRIEEINGKLEELKHKHIYLDLDKRGYLIASSQGVTLPSVAFAATPLAGDVQNRNLELFLDDEEWRIRLLKDVAPEQTIELWFSEDVLAKLDMPFLTPKNIKGRKSYVCHECNTQFEKPNPLKIHLFLSCQDYNIHKFWKKFHLKINEINVPLNLTINSFLPTKTTIIWERPRSHENSHPYDANKRSSPSSSRCNSEPPHSAFKPYKTYSGGWGSHANNNAVLPARLPADYGLQNWTVKPKQSVQNAFSNLWQLHTGVTTVSKSLERVSVANPEEIEALATNWGKSRDGHLCLYCGKVYSRKYGLKIHIRTHTGYKPLQCKYCFRPFGDPSNLNKHVRLHSQSETPYNCHLCGKMLVRKRDLERHLRSRHEGHDFKLDDFSRETQSPC